VKKTQFGTSGVQQYFRLREAVATE
jgi:hypothetical protein